MERNVLSLDSSILYRASQKHFDRIFSKYDLGYASALFLTQIYEKEGLTMNELAQSGNFDKGNITKSIQKLQDLGYVDVRSNDGDKRSKHLYTTKKAQDIIPSIYLEKQDWWDHLLQDLCDREFLEYVRVNNLILERAKEYDKDDDKADEVKFFGLQKLTLLDYPGNMAATLFTGGCNLRCPFCHNKGLVFLDEGNTELDQDEILSFLKERAKILDGVCISGGEPLIHRGLKDFIIKVKSMGLKVKLDTNGINTKALKELIDEGLVDYVAMDIKNSKAKYALTCGIDNVDMTKIEESVRLLCEGRVDYEFRTTIVKEFHTDADIEAMGKWLKGTRRMFFQNFEDSGHIIKEGLHAHDKETLYRFRTIMSEYIKDTYIRGME